MGKNREKIDMSIEKLQYLAVRFVLFLVFLAYYVVALAVNIDRIEDRFTITNFFKQDVVQLMPHLFSGPFQNEKNMLILIQKHNIKRVISLIDPRLPLYHELYQYQKNFCAKYRIEFINIPLGNFNQSKPNIEMLLDVIRSSQVPTYINGYLDDKGISKIIKAHRYDDRQNQ